MTPYSPIQRLADALFLNHDPCERYFIMLDTGYATYFDASGTRHNTAMLVVAGYFSNVLDWKTFDTEWNAALGRAGVPFFHMKKFTSFRWPFDNHKWRREETRRAFLDDLIGVIARNVDYGIVNILPIT